MGFEPMTLRLKVVCSTSWASSTKACPSVCDTIRFSVSTIGCHDRLSSGSRIWTCDLWVMSPTSFRTALSRNNISGQRRIRTFEGIAGGFTVRSVWPLWNLPIIVMNCTSFASHTIGEVFCSYFRPSFITFRQNLARCISPKCRVCVSLEQFTTRYNIQKQTISNLPSARASHLISL